MKYGYIRVSTKAQARDGNSLEVQEAAVRDAGAEMIFSDAYTGAKTDKLRPGLDGLMAVVQPGDMVIVTKLDRFARSLIQGAGLIDDLLKKGVAVNILNIGLMDESSSGRLIRHVMFSFAEFERDMISERTQAGKAVARLRPGYREGRKPKFTKAQFDHAMELLENNSYTQVEAMTGISRSTLLRERNRRKVL